MDVPSIPGYDVLSRIGTGGSAQVWRARRAADDLHVALKVVPTGPDRVSPALREAGILARVRHQHVIHLYDVVPVPGPDRRPAGVALAMELAEGGSLAEVLGARDHLTPGELVTVCSPLATALAELHRAGVVHGDLAPGNVLFHADGMPLLADLGVSRIAGERRTELHGTDGMVAPEVIEGFEPTSESDVYGLGALSWRCLVGEPPGWVGTRPELSELRPELPTELVTLVTSCLSGEPADRPEAEEVAVALFAAARPEPVALAPGADPAAGLTQRIRADLRGTRDDESTDDAPQRVRPGRRLRVPHPRALLRASDRRLRVPHPRALLRRSDRRPLPRWVGPLAAGGVAVAVIALLVSTWLGSVVGGHPAEAGAEGDRAAATVAPDSQAAPPHATPVPTSGSADAAPETAVPAVPDPNDRPSGAVLPPEPPVAGSPTAGPPESPGAEPPAAGPTGDSRARDDLQDAAQRLLDARAAAWRSGDPRNLDAVHQAGSPAYEQEQKSLTAAHDLDIRYAGLEFTVREVQVLASGPERAVLEVEVERSSYQEVTPTGETTHEQREDVVELELRRADGTWRIWGWGSAVGAQAGAATG
ncbi:serine/threonine-protein kinase [Ornithinimicrobium murale]|uniref:serine/threonine-protein kinase n=1 Tax=Ornithinimicrobium murale TaxID=1050153 RepID=UPI0013B42345|nr:serine/threonine-protein kinase [Ornithinimicrobium murale]